MRRIHVAKDIDRGPWTPLPFWKSPFPYFGLVVFGIIAILAALFL